MAKVIVTGIKDLDRKLRGLEPKVARKVVRQAIRRALQPIAAGLRADLPRQTGKLAGSVKVRAGPRKRGSISLVVMVDAKDEQGKYMYGAAEEYGTHRQAGQAVMRKTFDAKAEGARSQGEAEIRDGIVREARR